jgi:hypothetical protein
MAFGRYINDIDIVPLDFIDLMEITTRRILCMPIARYLDKPSSEQLSTSPASSIPAVHQ